MPVTAPSGISKKTEALSLRHARSSSRKIAVYIQGYHRGAVTIKVSQSAECENRFLRLRFPRHAARSRNHVRMEFRLLRFRKIGPFTSHNMMFVKQCARKVRPKKLTRERLVQASRESRLFLFITIDKRCIFRNGILAVTGRIAEGIRRFFPHYSAVEARAEPGLVFKPEDSIHAMSTDNIDAICRIRGDHRILPNDIFVIAVNAIQHPAVVERIMASKLGKHIVRSHVKGIGSLARRFAFAISTEFRKEFFAHILEHFRIQITEAKAEGIPEKRRSAD